MRGVAQVSIAALIGLTMVVGCSSKTGDDVKLVTVVGKVTLDGKPLAGASVNFLPKDSTKGTGGFAVTDADGRYETRHRSDAVGIEVGTYTVTFSKIALPDGSPIPQGKDAADVGAVEVLPPKLSNPPPEHAQNIITVTTGGGNFDFDLVSK